MSFSFSSNLADDVSWVRFHIADMDSNGYYLENETIQYFITDTSRESAVITCIENIIAQLSMPTTKLDWLSVDYSQARARYETLLKRKKQSLGVTSGATFATETHSPWRADSNQTDGNYTLTYEDE